MNDDGNSLYLIATDSDLSEDGEKCYLFMFDKRGDVISETGILELPKESYADYQQVLYDFKVANGWDFYYMTEKDRTDYNSKTV